MPRRGKGEERLKRARSSDDRWNKIAVLVAAAVIVPLVSVSACLGLSRSGGPQGPPTAAIVDQLSLTFPNPSFVQEAAVTLEQAGYLVDYYPGEVVTVDFFRNLPTKGYDFLLLRTHSALTEGSDGTGLTGDAALFTTEPFSPSVYVREQTDARLARVTYYLEGLPDYFGITAGFVAASMRGKFDDATIVMMGCSALGSAMLAKAFVEKGAKAVVGWSDLVSAGHTDAATERLLEYLLDGGLSVEEAVAQTMAELGPDPAYGSVLLSYPSEG